MKTTVRTTSFTFIAPGVFEAKGRYISFTIFNEGGSTLLLYDTQKPLAPGQSLVISETQQSLPRNDRIPFAFSGAGSDRMDIIADLTTDS